MMKGSLEVLQLHIPCPEQEVRLNKWSEIFRIRTLLVLLAGESGELATFGSCWIPPSSDSVDGYTLSVFDFRLPDLPRG